MSDVVARANAASATYFSGSTGVWVCAAWSSQTFHSLGSEESVLGAWAGILSGLVAVCTCALVVAGLSDLEGAACLLALVLVVGGLPFFCAGSVPPVCFACLGLCEILEGGAGFLSPELAVSGGAGCFLHGFIVS